MSKDAYILIRRKFDPSNFEAWKPVSFHGDIMHALNAAERTARAPMDIFVVIKTEYVSDIANRLEWVAAVADDHELIRARTNTFASWEDFSSSPELLLTDACSIGAQKLLRVTCLIMRKFAGVSNPMCELIVSSAERFAEYGSFASANIRSGALYSAKIDLINQGIELGVYNPIFRLIDVMTLGTPVESTQERRLMSSHLESFVVNCTDYDPERSRRVAEIIRSEISVVEILLSHVGRYY